MNGGNTMKRVICIILALTLVLAASPLVIASAGLSGGKKLLSASDEWTMGNGWMDVSTAEKIVLRNTKDTAGPNFNKNLIDGAEGFLISFDLEFLDPTLQSSAIIDLRINSQSDRHFRLIVTGRGDEAMFQVDYNDGGTWINAVPFVAGMYGIGGKVTVRMEREAGSDAVSFTLLTRDGTQLYSQTVTNKAWAGNRFLNSSDLEFILTPLAGYGLFEFSNYSVQAYPDDGIDDGPTLTDIWNLGSNWEGTLENGTTSISNVIQNAGPAFYRELIPAGDDFRVSFLYTAKSNYTTADITLRLTVNNGVYIRMLVTKNEAGQALVDVNYHDGNWHSLCTTGWIGDVGDSYRVMLEHAAGTDTMRLILTKPDGTLITTLSMGGNACTNAAFFSVSDIEALVTTAGDYGLFTVSEFTLHGDPVEAAKWSMGANWDGYYDDSGDYVIKNLIENAGPNFYSEHIGAGQSFRLRFLYTGVSDYTTGDIVMRLTANNSVYLQARTTQNGGTALIDFDFFDGANWHRLASTGWIADVGKSYYVNIDHTAGSDMAALTIEKPDGTVAYSAQLQTAACTDASFFSVSNLEVLVNTCGNYGIFSIGGLTISEAVAASDVWELGAGWKDAGGYDGAAIANTTDTNAGSAVWKETIDGIDGVTIDFDFEAAVEAMQTTAELILRRTDNHSTYIRMVITARGPREYIVDTEYYLNGVGVRLDSTGWLAADNVGGKYHVHISHQAGSSDTALVLTAMDGTELYSKRFANAALTDKDYWSASYLQLLVNPIPGYGCFTVSNMETGDHPAEPVDSDLWECGSGWKIYPDGDGIYIAKTNKAQTEIHYTQPINGKEGFKVSFDVSFDSLSTSVCYWKLRQPNSPEIYLFGRVKGDNNQTMLEAQSYISETDDWSTSLLSAKAGKWTANSGGMITVTVARQAFSNEIHYIAVDANTGAELFHEVFTSSVLTADAFLDRENLAWTFGTDEGSPTFKIRNFTVETWPGEAVAAQTVAVTGEQKASVGGSLTFGAQIAPDNANIKSLEWLVDGVRVGRGESLVWKFDKAGTVEIECKVTDYGGNTVSGRLAVVVEPVYPLGDVDLNGIVDAADAQLLCDYIVGAVQLTEKQLSLADVNADQVCDSKDVYWILAGREE